MDRLKIPTYNFYSGLELYQKNKAKDTMDEVGKKLVFKACERKQIQEAKKHSFERRTYSPDYLTRSEDGKKMYLDNFEHLGARWVKPFGDILNPRDGHSGWYTDDFGGTLKGVVLCFTRHGVSDEDFGGDGKFTGRRFGQRGNLYMAGTQHSEWDGVTLDLDTTDDPDTAARWADSMAKREAERCREDEEKYQAEQEAEEAAEAAIEEEHAI